jgi:hypothetical protein
VGADNVVGGKSGGRGALGTNQDESGLVKDENTKEGGDLAK